MSPVKRHLGTTVMCFTGLLATAGYATGADFGNGVELHGYGTQTYMQSATNIYLGADDLGTWNNNFLGLVGTVNLNEKSKLWAQLEASSSTTNSAATFTWMFVDYQVSNDLRAHVGRVKYPLGLYNEIINAKFLQLSSLEPSIYQTAADFVHDAYNGIGLDYDQHFGSAGKVIWQIYGGNTYDRKPPADSRDRRALGARATWETPVDGLRFMVSGYRTQVQTIADNSYSMEDRRFFSVDYVNNGWNFKSEYANHTFNGVDSNGYYVQLGRTVAEKWTPFVRLDYVTTNEAQTSDESFYQKTFVLGIDYKLESNLSIRVENHFNQGYALPVASGEVPQGTGRGSWNMFVVGAHFIF